MGEHEEVGRRVRTIVDELAEQVRGHFHDPALARLWVAGQIRRAIEGTLDELLAQARPPTPGSDGRKRTWEEVGAVLGMSAQGARQRLLRRRGPVSLPSMVREADASAMNEPRTRD